MPHNKRIYNFLAKSTKKTHFTVTIDDVIYVQ